MNHQILLYYVGSLATSTSLSEQCTRVREILLVEDITDKARLVEILKILNGVIPIFDDTAEFLNRGIRGHYGGEGYALDVTWQEEAAFWYTLHLRFPEHAKLCLIAADAAYLAHQPNDLQLFSRALELDPSLISKLEGSVTNKILDSGASPIRLQYELILLRHAVKQHDQDYISEVESELRVLFRENAIALQEIDKAIKTGSLI